MNNVIINFEAPPSLKKKAMKAAKNQGLSLSSYLRILIRKDIDKK